MRKRRPYRRLNVDGTPLTAPKRKSSAKRQFPQRLVVPFLFSPAINAGGKKERERTPSRHSFWTTISCPKACWKVCPLSLHQLPRFIGISGYIAAVDEETQHMFLPGYRRRRNCAGQLTIDSFLELFQEIDVSWVPAAEFFRQARLFREFSEQAQTAISNVVRYLTSGSVLAYEREQRKRWPG